MSEWVLFGSGAPAGLGAESIGSFGVLMDTFSRLGLESAPGVTVPMDRLEQLDQRRAGIALCTLPGASAGGLFRVSVSAETSIAGLPADLLCLGLTRDSLDVHATTLGRRSELCQAWALTLRTIAEYGLQVPSAALTDLAFDVPEPVAQVDRLLELCATAGIAPYPDDPAEQLVLAARAMRTRWASPRAQRARRAQGLPTDLGLALHVQEQPVGSWDQTGHGVAVSRDGVDGSFAPNGRYGHGLRLGDADLSGGEDLSRLPEVQELVFSAIRALEVEFRGVVEARFEFSPQGVWLVGASIDRRPAGRVLAGLSVDLVELGVMDKVQALQGFDPYLVNEMLHPRLRLTGQEHVLARGIAASPGAATGQVVFSSERALELADAGAHVVLVAQETSPADVPGMLASVGIVTSRGGSASHAAVVARGIGRPAICGVHGLVIVDGATAVAGGRELREGDTVSIDGWAGALYEGAVDVQSAEPSAALTTMLHWADDVRRLGVRVNADNPRETAAGLALGAEGIGLCRTEHQFLGERLPLIQSVLMARGPDEEATALVALAEAQREDFRELLRAVGNRPVTVRLLDAPLHEFLPAGEGQYTQAGHAELADELREANPMMGVRGVRLAVLHRGLYPAQARALFNAWVDVRADGIHPRLEVMIPLVSMGSELAFAADLVRREAEAVALQAGVRVPYLLGTMVETPRAALLAGELARVAEFLSFGTNDLTQLTYGLSRDDVERRLMGPYLEQGLLPASPFVALDADGVGELIALASARARAVRPDIKLGLCGEHGGHPESVALCHRLGLDYVSCSPQRVPLARLAAARAVQG